LTEDIRKATFGMGDTVLRHGCAMLSALKLAVLHLKSRNMSLETIPLS